MREPMLVNRIHQVKDDVVTYTDRYEVKFDDDVATFCGTYTQCLTFIGARVLGKTVIVAARFALGTYR